VHIKYSLNISQETRPGLTYFCHWQIGYLKKKKKIITVVTLEMKFQVLWEVWLECALENCTGRDEIKC